MLDDFSFGKILLIVLLVLIFFGPKKIPDIAQSIGKGIREFKKAMSDVTDEIKKPINDEPKSGSVQAKAAESSVSQSSQAESHSKTELK